ARPRRLGIGTRGRRLRCTLARVLPQTSGLSKDALILLVIPESRSDIRDPVPLRINTIAERHWIPAFAGMTKTELIRPSLTPRTRKRNHHASPTVRRGADRRPSHACI